MSYLKTEVKSEPPYPDDIGGLVSDSFSDINSDDSGSWMQKIDVTNFKQLTDEPQANPLTLDHGGYTTAQQQTVISPSFPSPDSVQSAKSEPVEETSSIVHADSTVEMPPTAGKSYIKPMYSYSCLIALSLKNSKSGRLTVAEIYNFMCENFPYFRTAPAGWKNSVRHNLSLNKCFEKIEIETPGGHGRKSCLWTLNPAKLNKMDQEIRKWREKDPSGVRDSLANPDDLELIEKGLKGLPGENNPYLLPAFSELVGPAASSHLLLVRSSQLPYLSRFSSQQYSDGRPVMHNAQMLTQHQSWPTEAKVARVAPATPPRARSTQEYVSQTAFSTPVGQQSHINVHQSSPFAQTPPYSPNVHSPQLKFGCEWASTPRTEPLYQYSPYSATKTSALFPTYTDAYSPCKMNQMGAYEAASSALNNNSLLQTALAQSPCRAPATVHLQSL